MATSISETSVTTIGSSAPKEKPAVAVESVKKIPLSAAEVRWLLIRGLIEKEIEKMPDSSSIANG